MMTVPPLADLELSLTHQQDDTYVLYFTLTWRDDGTKSVSDPFTIRLDEKPLREKVLQPDKYGASLSNIIFDDKNARAVFHKARGGSLATKHPLRLRLFLPNKLQHLYWELLVDPEDGRSLALQHNLYLTRFLSTDHDHYGPAGPRPTTKLRALVVVAAPAATEQYRLAPIEPEVHLAAAHAALGDLETTDFVVTGRSDISWDDISERLKEGYDILYLVAHGRYREEQPWLFVPGLGGNGEWKSAVPFANLVKALGEHRPRMIVLASCESAGDGYEHQAALGPLLARSGVGAVLAMQGHVSIPTTQQFIGVFFHELLRDGCADRALTSARISVSQSDADWWRPVLYTRLPDGKLWNEPKAESRDTVSVQEAINLLWKMPVTPRQAIPPVRPLPAGSQVTLPHNSVFTGRENELRHLARALRGRSRKGVAPIVAITGLGGIGKTQLACEFAHRYGHYFAGGVYWFEFIYANEKPDAASVPNDTNPDQKRINELSLGTSANPTPEDWHSSLPRLLIFDNCEHVELIEKFRAKASACRILITSRKPAWDPALGVEIIPLNGLEPDESINLLRHYSPHLSSNDPHVQAIAAELDNLPLALYLAGHYLSCREISPAAYLDALRQPGLLRHRSMAGLTGAYSPTRHVLDVGRTFALSFDQLQPQNPVDGLAQRLLARLAHFELGAAVEKDLVYASATDDQDAAIAARLRLTALGLIAIDESGQLLSSHRLVAQFGRMMADDQARADVLQTLRKRMRSEPDEITRRTRAFQLTRLRWLDDVQPIPTAEFLEYAELIARYAASPVTRAYLDENFSALLKSTSATVADRDRAHLLVLRASLRGRQGKLKAAQADYAAAKSIVENPDLQDGQQPENHHLKARIGLGLGNVICTHVEQLSEQEKPLGPALLAEAAQSYHLSIAAAKMYQTDPALVAAALCELGHCESLLQHWDEAESACREAIQVLKQAQARIDKQTYTHYYATVLEVMSTIYWERGCLSSRITDYRAAYCYALKAIRHLRPHARRESEKLYMAHYNAGEYLIEIGNNLEQLPLWKRPTIGKLNAKVCRHWTIALDLAQRLGNKDEERDVLQLLKRHCAKKPTIILPDLARHGGA